MSQTILGAVLAPPLLPQDMARITRMELIRIPDGAEPLRLDEMTAWCRRQAPALWGRALAGIPRFRHNLTEIRRAMLGRGCSPRLADQVGTILAARAMILEDEPLDAMAAEDDILAVSWLIRTQAEVAEEDGPARCLQHLLASQADALESGERPTFSALIERSLRAADDDARRKLINHGLKVGRHPHAPPGREWLLVANTHPQLTRVFAGTHWAGGRWTGDLKRLPGAVVPSNSVSFRLNDKHRCVAIPAECFDPDDGDVAAGRPMPPPAPHAAPRLSVH